MATSKAQDKGSEQAEEQAKAPEVPLATWDAGLYQLPQYKPVVTGPDGARYECVHHWGHSDERAARKCAGSLASKAGVRLA